jgi:hypothetical protein
MTSPMAARMLYLELTALLIGREIAKFERGEQVALVSFTNIAKLAGNASQELTRSGMRAHMKARGACVNGHPPRHSLNPER